MARPGPKQQARRLGHSPHADWTEVANRPYEGPSPDLPRLPGGEDYHPLVVAWWDMVRHMPHCVTWAPTDWQFAVETALLKHFFWTDAGADKLNMSAGTEMRRREDMLGTTEEARAKRRLRYVEVDEDDEFEDDGPVVAQVEPEVVTQRRAGGAPPVTSLASRRARALAEQQQADTA